MVVVAVRFSRPGRYDFRDIKIIYGVAGDLRGDLVPDPALAARDDTAADDATSGLLRAGRRYDDG